MKTRIAFVIALLLSLTACSRSAQKLSVAQETRSMHEGQIQVGDLKQVSLTKADQADTSLDFQDRKLIRNGEIKLEAASPAEVLSKISSMAESLGGFVVTSQTKQRQSSDASSRDIEISLVVRVPAAKFGVAMDQIRALGSRIIAQKSSTDDVTEEFIDLEARLKTQRALEAQFLEIMKQANKVSDALEVHRQIAEVRTEIEKLEGRKRYIENKSSLSTITVGLEPPTAIVVSTSGFGRSIKEAITDGVDVAGSIVLFLVRVVIGLVPVVLFIFLPAALLVRFLVRKVRRPQVVAVTTATE
jgi:hypothetical protein